MTPIYIREITSPIYKGEGPFITIVGAGPLYDGSYLDVHGT